MALSVAEALERPELLGVKPADHPPDEPGLPTLVPYVRRELDTAVAELVRGGLAGGSTAVLVTGARATGKTRACFEALRRLPAGWRLWRPEPEPPGRALPGWTGSDPTRSSGSTRRWRCSPPRGPAAGRPTSWRSCSPTAPAAPSWCSARSG